MDVVENLAEVVGERVGSCDDLRAGLDLDGAVTAVVLTNFLIDQPVWLSIQRLTASAANTMVRCQPNRLPTDTIYVTTIPPSSPGAPGTVSVYNGATCNATATTGCGQVPHSAPVGFDPYALAVNARTDTIYVASFSQNNKSFAGNTVSVIDGATCNATNTTGCHRPPQTITVGPAFTTPIGVAVDQATGTIYVADLQNGEGSGTVSVINGAVCNATTTTTGCGHTPPAVTVGFGPAGIAFDPANQTIVVANVEDTSISVINAATCNATVTTSCHSPQPKFPAGRGPNAIAIDPAAQTIYTANLDNTVSIIPAGR